MDGEQYSVVIQTSFLGDMVLTTPLLSELAARGPVDVVATPQGAALLANHPAVHAVVSYDKRGADAGATGVVRLARRLRRQLASDPNRARRVAYLAQGSVRSAILAQLAGIRERVGFSTSAGRLLYTRRIPYAADRHHAERLWRLASPELDGAGAARLRPRLYPGPGDIAAVEHWLAQSGLRHESFIALAPGSSWGTKRWPHFADLARRLSAGGRVVVIGGDADRDAAEQIMAAAPGRAWSAVACLGLLGTAELIRRAVALVSNDSVSVHLASAVDTPTVALFGPTVPAFGFAPLSPRSAVAEVADLPCRPCDRHGPMVCPLAHWRCMRELSAERVESLITSLLPARSS